MIRLLIISLAAFFLFGQALAKTLPPPESPTPPTVSHALPEHKHTAACEKTTAEPVQIICILDRSGSMSSLAKDTIGGYNSFLDRQKKSEGKAQVTTILFDHKYEKISDAVDLNDVPELTSTEYYARGTTALLDAVGMTIMDVAGKMEQDGVCPAKRRVLIMIMTDGYENASKEYNKAAVKSLIETTTKNYNWNYVFLGANIDSASEATSIGINQRHAANYSHDSQGVEKSFEMMNRAAEEVRETGTVDDVNNGDK